MKCLIYLSVFAVSACHFSEIHQVNAVNCGEVILARPLIVNGTVTLRGEWPFIVALYQVKHPKYFCGGTLISHKHVLTGIERLFC